MLAKSFSCPDSSISVACSLSHGQGHGHGLCRGLDYDFDYLSTTLDDITISGYFFTLAIFHLIPFEAHPTARL